MAWQDDFRRVPISRLVLGTVCGWALTGFLCFWLTVVPKFDEHERIDVVGALLESSTPSVAGQPVLDFAIEGQSARFRVLDGVFADALGGRVPSALHRGANLRLTVAKDEYEEPFSPEPYRVPTVTVDAIRVGDSDVLSLSDSREWHRQNRRWAEILAPVFAACATLLSVTLIIRLSLRSGPRAV
jgi:hypothetical protein